MYCKAPYGATSISIGIPAIGIEATTVVLITSVYFAYSWLFSAYITHLQYLKICKKSFFMYKHIHQKVSCWVLIAFHSLNIFGIVDILIVDILLCFQAKMIDKSAVADWLCSLNKIGSAWQKFGFARTLPRCNICLTHFWIYYYRESCSKKQL